MCVQHPGQYVIYYLIKLLGAEKETKQVPLSGSRETGAEWVVGEKCVHLDGTATRLISFDHTLFIHLF